MRLLAITDRRLFSGDEREQCAALLRQAERWVSAGVEIIQLREKDLQASALEDLAGQLVELADQAGSSVRTRILINASAAGAFDMARKVGAAGVHLPGRLFASGTDKTLRQELTRLFEGWPALAGGPMVSVACHTVSEVFEARISGASLAVFAPIFEKPREGAALSGVGLDALRGACVAASPMPVFALGGVSVANAALCMDAGAAGVAGIRLFADEAWKPLASL